jgi:hypothetical protein
VRSLIQVGSAPYLRQAAGAVKPDELEPYTSVTTISSSRIYLTLSLRVFSCAKRCLHVILSTYSWTTASQVACGLGTTCRTPKTPHDLRNHLTTETCSLEAAAGATGTIACQVIEGQRSTIIVTISVGRIAMLRLVSFLAKKEQSMTVGLCIPHGLGNGSGFV